MEKSNEEEQKVDGKTRRKKKPTYKWVRRRLLRKEG